MTLIEASLGELIADLQKKHGRDLSNYRLSCLQRRVALRMSVLSLSTLDQYMTRLADDPGEIDRLLDAVTIHVTEFFRDQDVFEAISNDILPATVERKHHSPSRTIRFWSAGCSTGEETYSLAIITLQYLQKHDVDLDLEIYGTDISKEACTFARAGVYPERKIERIPVGLRQEYFEPVEDGFIVAADVKRRVRFSVHDLFSAPPLSLLDIVMCRNVLIHFNNAVRNDVLGRFHTSLEDSGILILGKSEAVMGTALKLYRLIDPRNKIYQKIILRSS
ncbi:MAG: protein-glutamate O-methyltransferase CheR [Candidatus Krumholzibacteria bacterium]|nr:protein-glutamate O-methyltransferase CheR [Candidatus Krumholzibacteria bacterium]